MGGDRTVRSPHFRDGHRLGRGPRQLQSLPGQQYTDARDEGEGRMGKAPGQAEPEVDLSFVQGSDPIPAPL